MIVRLSITHPSLAPISADTLTLSTAIRALRQSHEMLAMIEALAEFDTDAYDEARVEFLRSFRALEIVFYRLDEARRALSKEIRTPPADPIPETT